MPNRDVEKSNGNYDNAASALKNVLLLYINEHCSESC